VGELLDGGDDDLLTALQSQLQLLRAGDRGDDVLHFGELLDVVLELPVQHLTVSDHHHRIKDRLITLLGIDLNQLIGGPGDGIGLA